VQDGDLWAKTLPHGVPVRITASGKASYPRWSHSGEWLAYGDGSSEWIARADGSDTREVHDFGWWSPVDDRYAGSNSDGAIITRNAAGTDERIVVPAPTSGEGQTARFGGMAWSPDGQWLAYTVEVQGTTGTPPYREASMWVVSADGGTPTKVYDGGSPSRDDVGIVGWSPEGLALFYTLDPSFSADIPADGLPLEALVVFRGGGVATGERPRLFAPRPATTLLHDELRAMGPRKTSIVVTEGAGRETWTNKRVSHVSWVDGVVVGLTAPDVAAIEPAESPDGERIAYVAAPDAPGVPGGDAAKAAMALRRIWVMDADGSNRRQLTDDPAYRDERPMWSGDGSRIYFVRLDTDDKASVWSVPSGGGEPTELVNDVLPVPAQEGAPAWFGYYGYIAWDSVFALWTAPAPGAP
jgi:dipeptidyl aminopeptidase/acylaminoacyl peptidase